jgi:Tol biopolymer transport system component
MVDPDGKNEKTLARDSEMFPPHEARLSPDGRTVAVLVVPGPLPPDDGTNTTKRAQVTLHVRGIDEKAPGTNLGLECAVFAWSPDGTKIAASEFVDKPRAEKPNSTHFLIDVRTKEKTALKLPDDHLITDWSPDGKFFLTTRARKGPDGPTGQLYLMNRDGTEHTALTDPGRVAYFGRFSPDGRRVLYQRYTEPKGLEAPPRRDLFVLDVPTGRAEAVADLPLNGDVQGYCWSPDGKRIAYTWRELHAGDPKEAIDRETESHLVVCDPDGRNAKTVVTEKGKGQWVLTLGGLDWR